MTARFRVNRAGAAAASARPGAGRPLTLERVGLCAVVLALYAPSWPFFAAHGVVGGQRDLDFYLALVCGTLSALFAAALNLTCSVGLDVYAWCFSDVKPMDWLRQPSNVVFGSALAPLELRSWLVLAWWSSLGFGLVHLALGRMGQSRGGNGS